MRSTLIHDELPSSLASASIKPSWLDELERVAWSSVPILITDGNDSRRHTLARSVHELSGFQRGPFVVWSCQIADASGKTRLSTRMAIQDARGGSLFLDAIERMPQEDQAELYAFLTDELLEGAGTDDGIGRSVRLITGTNAPLLARIKDGAFDEALFYRLNAIHVVVDEGC